MIDSWMQYRCGLLAQMTGSQIASWTAIFMVVFIIFANKRRGSQCVQRRSWLKTFAMLMLIVFATLVVLRFIAGLRHAKFLHAEQAERAAVATSHVALMEREHMEREHQERVRKFEQEQTARANEALAKLSMHELWDKLHQPRIKLDGEQAVMAVGEGAGQVKVTVPSEVRAAVTVPLSEKTSESLADSIARLEQMLERASDVADQVSEAGTLVGKAMIALNETIESRARTNKAPATAAVTATASPKAIAADPVAPAELRTVEIKFDGEKLRQANLRFDDVRTVLGKDGYFRGNSVRFVPNEQRIVVTGAVASDFESRLAGTLLGTMESSGRAVHTSDVAVITPSPDSLELEIASAQDANGAAPAWIGEPPKRIGNTWREVIVAGEYATKEECYRAADIYLLLATYNHLQQLSGRSAQLTESWRPDLKFDGTTVMSDGDVMIADGEAYDDRLRNLAKYGMGIDFVRREVARGEYWQQVDRSFGPMVNLYTLVEFTPSVDTELLRRWNDYRRDERLFTVGAGAGSVLGFLGLALGLLKVDTWTKGYYSKRLFLGVPAAIIGVLALLSLLGV